MCSVNGNPQYRKNLRVRLHTAQGGCCKYCGRKLQLPEATFDHVVPLALGGAKGAKNLVVACITCNRKKGCKPPHLWFGELAQGLVA